MLDRMARAGEIEVFRINPEVGKCYKHVEATRNDTGTVICIQLDSLDPMCIE